MAAIAYWCATRHVPAVQQQIQANAEAAVSSVVASDVTTTVYGRTVTLKGSVANENQKAELLTALNTADGVRHINDDELTVINSVATATQSDDTNAPMPQNNSSSTQTPEEPAAELATAQVPSPDAPAADSPSGNVTPIVTPATQSPAPEAPAPEAPTPEGPTPATQTAQITPPAPPPPGPSTPEAPPTAEVLSPDSATPEVAPPGPSSPESPSPETPTPETLSAEAPSPASPANSTSSGPVGPSPDKTAQPATVELAELAVANEPASNNPDALSPESADTSPSLIDALEAESSTFSMQIEDGTLTLTGDISSEDDSLGFIQSAMRTFDVNYLVNSMQVNEENSKASWLPALTEFIPSMQPVSDANITIVESQITLSGTAPDKQTHNKIIDEALSLLSELSLIDSIVVGSDDPIPAAASEPQAAATTEPAGTSPQAGSTSQQITQNTAQPAEQPDAEQTVTTAEQLTTLREAFKALEAEKILFRSGSDVLTDESIQTIAAMSALLAKYTDINIEIDGHTDSAGSSENNLQLSQLRANAVRDLMIERGIARERLSAYGFGDGVPIADNSTADGRKLNRRIEFNF